MVGIVGHPPREALEPLWQDPSVTLADLDVAGPDLSLARADALLPRVYCAVLRTVAANALTLRPDRIVADVGEGKCDGMRFLAEVLADSGFEVERTHNLSTASEGTPLCVSGLPLVEKMERITARLSTGVRDVAPRAPARAGFWGVPPADFSFLELFPDNTHVFGWTRCLENGTPADLDLEMHVDPGLPTVFFAQSFCQKNGLAKHLADRHGGICVDGGERMSRADRAKIEAFFAFNLDRGGEEA